VDSLKYSFR